MSSKYVPALTNTHTLRTTTVQFAMLAPGDTHTFRTNNEKSLYLSQLERVAVRERRRDLNAGED